MPAGSHRARLRGAHAGLAARFQHVRRRLDLRPARQSRLAGTGRSGLEYHDPRFDPHEAFQQFKTHPFVRAILEGGKLVRYGAKTVPYGGWYSMPRTYVDGGLIIGDSASLLNSQRLKGIHMAIKSGMLAAETIFDALRAGDASSKTLAAFPQQDRAKLDREGTVGVRNFHQALSQRSVARAWCTRRCSSSPAGAVSIDPMRTRPRLRGVSQAQRRPGPRQPRVQGRRQADLRPSDRRLPLRHAPRRRSAVPSCTCSIQHLRRPLRDRIRKSLPVFLSRRRLRNGRGKRTAGA